MENKTAFVALPLGIAGPVTPEMTSGREKVIMSIVGYDNNKYESHQVEFYGSSIRKLMESMNRFFYDTGYDLKDRWRGALNNTFKAFYKDYKPGSPDEKECTTVRLKAYDESGKMVDSYFYYIYGFDGAVNHYNHNVVFEKLSKIIHERFVIVKNPMPVISDASTLRNYDRGGSRIIDTLFEPARMKVEKKGEM